MKRESHAESVLFWESISNAVEPMVESIKMKPKANTADIVPAVIAKYACQSDPADPLRGFLTPVEWLLRHAFSEMTSDTSFQIHGASIRLMPTFGTE